MLTVNSRRLSSQLRKDPFTGTVFVFRSRKADRLKLLFWDGTGLVSGSAIKVQKYPNSMGQRRRLRTFIVRQVWTAASL